MSDTKWRKLFAALDRSDLELGQMIVKFIDDGDEQRISTPGREALYPPRAYIDAATGPFALRRIEWIELPFVAEYERNTMGSGKIAPRTVPQDVDEARRIVEALGQFPMEITDRGLRITGHVRQ
jgi:hypothetical protein